MNLGALSLHSLEDLKNGRNCENYSTVIECSCFSVLCEECVPCAWPVISCILIYLLNETRRQHEQKRQKQNKKKLKHDFLPALLSLMIPLFC